MFLIPAMPEKLRKFLGKQVGVKELTGRRENKINKALLKNLKNKYESVLNKKGLMDEEYTTDEDYTWIKYREKPYVTLHDHHCNLDLSEYYNGEKIKLADCGHIKDIIRNKVTNCTSSPMDWYNTDHNISKEFLRKEAISRLETRYYCDWDIRYNGGFQLKDDEGNHWTALLYRVYIVRGTVCESCEHVFPRQVMFKDRRIFMEKIKGRFKTRHRGWY